MSDYTFDQFDPSKLKPMNDPEDFTSPSSSVSNSQASAHPFRSDMGTTSSVQAGNTSVHGQNGVPIPTYEQMTNPHATQNKWMNALNAFLAPMESGILGGIANRNFPGGFGRGMALGAMEGQQNYIKQTDEEAKLNNYLDKSMNANILKQGAYAKMKNMFAINDPSIAGLSPQQGFDKFFAEATERQAAGKGLYNAIIASGGNITPGLAAAIDVAEHSANTSAGTAANQQADVGAAQSQAQLQHDNDQISKAVHSGEMDEQAANKARDAAWAQHQQRLQNIQGRHPGAPGLPRPQGVPGGTAPAGNPLTMTPPPPSMWQNFKSGVKAVAPMFE